MKVKLIKTNEEFMLNPSMEGVKLSLLNPSMEGVKLSLKNCQAIERGYDLDELVEEWVFETNSHKWSNNDDTAGDNYGSFKAGFQKALELMGDKKFSEEDVRKAIMGFYMDDKILIESNINKQIQSLQQTEWDVKIEMEVVPDFDSRPDIDGQLFTTNKKIIPLLDADGCLILKRI